MLSMVCLWNFRSGQGLAARKFRPVPAETRSSACAMGKGKPLICWRDLLGPGAAAVATAATGAMVPPARRLSRAGAAWVAAGDLWSDAFRVLKLRAGGRFDGNPDRVRRFGFGPGSGQVRAGVRGSGLPPGGAARPSDREVSGRDAASRRLTVDGIRGWRPSPSPWPSPPRGEGRSGHAVGPGRAAVCLDGPSGACRAGVFGKGSTTAERC
jgi:hypothetical protein